MLDTNDFKEIKKKDGTRVVFCKFEDLLMDAYGASSMEEVKTHANSTGEYIIHCPFCAAEGHTKHKLYIKDDLTVGHCFVCGRTYINVTDTVSVDYRVPDFGAFLNMGSTFSPVILSNPMWSLDKFNYEFDEYDEKGVQYLTNRNPYLGELWKSLGIKFWEGNIALPFWYGGNIIYYQIRFTGQNKIRYFFPPISDKPVWILERQGEARKKLLIVEGIFDAIAALVQAPEYTPIAVMGSSVSDYQLGMIRDYGGYIENIKIWMDETSISKKIYGRLKSAIDYCPIDIIPSYGPDPEEVLNERIQLGQPIQWIR